MRRTDDDAVWVMARPDPRAATALAAEIGVSPLLGQVLLNRGYADAAAARAFLLPDLAALPDPRTLPDLPLAAERILAAVRGGEPIAVYGDYDADGVSGTAILVSFLRTLGAAPRPYLPDRTREGYGLNAAAVTRLAAEGVRLLVAVDTGTTAHEEIALARRLGLGVVVLDHHTPGPERPAAEALVNPHGGPTTGAAPCATGVVFHLVWHMARELAGGCRVSDTHREFLTEALSLAALGTIADVVSLRGGNRLLARFGLPLLGRSRRPGIRALLEIAGLSPGTLTATDVGYQIAPRLNAAGRLGSAELALELLLTEDEGRAREIAAALDRENRRRREIEGEILARACERVDEEYGESHAGGIVLADPTWHAGVIGIVAARLADRYCRPVALVAFDGETGRGSCRSVPAVSLPDALARCAGHLESFGGHAAAAGFTIRAGEFPAFREAFDRAVQEIAAPGDLRRRLRIDASAPLTALTPAVVQELDRLAPFGEGNPKPVFATRGLRTAGRLKRMGRDGDHIHFLVSDGTVSLRAVGFRMASRLPRLLNADAGLDIAYTPRIDEWQGRETVELELSDVVPAGGRPPF